jgi:hypothetical protein
MRCNYLFVLHNEKRLQVDLYLGMMKQENYLYSLTFSLENMAFLD